MEYADSGFDIDHAIELSQIVVIGRGMLRDPYWAAHAAITLRNEHNHILNPR
ncbi:hypothetical protein [Paenibacillus sp. FSL H8-0537]|uniref:hypothetical protein n=1 Tax=Paenibacillus sp. FSL H8-0537 TaxID=2921399 RepID=UPI003100CD7D